MPLLHQRWCLSFRWSTRIDGKPTAISHPFPVQERKVLSGALEIRRSALASVVTLRRVPVTDRKLHREPFPTRILPPCCQSRSPPCAFARLVQATSGAARFEQDTTDLPRTHHRCGIPRIKFRGGRVCHSRVIPVRHAAFPTRLRPPPRVIPGRGSQNWYSKPRLIPWAQKSEVR